VRIVAGSDVHGALGRKDPRVQDLPEGDVLILAGDILPNYYHNDQRDAEEQLSTAIPELRRWVEEKAVNFSNVLLTWGNHDWVGEKMPRRARKSLGPLVQLLEDQETIIDGVKFYGSPWSLPFCGWAFMLPDNNLKTKWNRIPIDVDVLFTHGPPYGILDRPGGLGHHCGGRSLRDHVIHRAIPAVHIFGHLHGSHGSVIKEGFPRFYNVAICNEMYEPTNPWTVIDI